MSFPGACFLFLDSYLFSARFSFSLPLQNPTSITTILFSSRAFGIPASICGLLLSTCAMSHCPYGLLLRAPRSLVTYTIQPFLNSLVRSLVLESSVPLNSFMSSLVLLSRARVVMIVRSCRMRGPDQGICAQIFSVARMNRVYWYAWHFCPNDRAIAERTNVVGIFVVDAAFGASPAFGGGWHFWFCLEIVGF